jgi:rRNA-processing protein FCF1
VHRVVDAMNVIGSRPDGWWRDRPRAIERLVERLDRWAAAAGERVTVVLEQPPGSLATAERVEVVWAPEPGRDSADRELLRRLGGWLAEGAVTVVTSDRELAEEARRRGAEVEPAAAFRSRLDEA